MADPLPSTSAGMSSRKRQADTLPLSGYIVTTSPVKKSKTGKPYFESYIQTKDETVKVVGFSAHKRLRLKEFEKNVIPVKIPNLRFQIESTGSKTFFLNDTAQVEGTQVDYEPEMIEYKDIEIANLTDFGDDHLRLRAQVIKVLPIQISNYNNLRVQDIFVAQDSYKIQVTLWNDLVSKVKVGDSVLITNVKIKPTDPPYITTTPNTEIQPVKEVAINLDELKDEDQIEDSLTGKIISVISVNKYLKCVTCAAPLHTEQQNQEELIDCKTCKSTSLKEMCSQDLVVKLNFRPNDKDIVPLTIYADKLVHLIPNLLTCDSNEIKLALLKSGTLRIVVSKLNQKVQAVNLVWKFIPCVFSYFIYYILMP